jgi:mono/diheme cytochrome c family protein
MKTRSPVNGLVVGALLVTFTGCAGRAPRSSAAAETQRNTPTAGTAAEAAQQPGQAVQQLSAQTAPEPSAPSAQQAAGPSVQEPAGEPARPSSDQPPQPASVQPESPPQPAPSPGARTGMMGGRGMMGGMMGSMTGQPADTTPVPTVSAAAATAPECPKISQALVDVGHRIFTGSGNCYACHGSNAQGTTLAPNLADTTWLDIDGSYAAIAELVRTGVPHPKRYPAPMPPMGGAQLSTEQVCAVAAYVHGLGGGR